MDSDSKVVGFKLDDENRAKLTGQAKELGISRNLLARDLVLKALNEEQDMWGAILALHQRLHSLREELALIAEVLLSHAGRVEPGEAKKWTDENLKPD